MRLQFLSEDSCWSSERVSATITRMHMAFDAQKQTEGQPGNTGDNLERWATSQKDEGHTPGAAILSKTSATNKENMPPGLKPKGGIGVMTTNDHMEIDPPSQRTGCQPQSLVCFYIFSNLIHQDQRSNSCWAEDRQHPTSLIGR